MLTEEGVPPKICNNIGYFGQTWERLEGADTTFSILRKFQPFVLQFSYRIYNGQQSHQKKIKQFRPEATKKSFSCSLVVKFSLAFISLSLALLYSC